MGGNNRLRGSKTWFMGCPSKSEVQRGASRDVYFWVRGTPAGLGVGRQGPQDLADNGTRWPHAFQPIPDSARDPLSGRRCHSSLAVRPDPGEVRETRIFRCARRGVCAGGGVPDQRVLWGGRGEHPQRGEIGPDLSGRGLGRPRPQTIRGPKRPRRCGPGVSDTAVGRGGVGQLDRPHHPHPLASGPIWNDD